MFEVWLPFRGHEALKVELPLVYIARQSAGRPLWLLGSRLEPLYPKPLWIP